jgi:predicted HTH transcriptional regulator
VTDEHFARLLELGHELRGVEFKPPGMRTDRELMAWVMHAALGMANRRDGGIVIVGVIGSQEPPVPVGLTDDELASWTYDDIASTVSSCSDPPLSFEREVRTYKERPYVVLTVHEFAELPILARKDVPGKNNRPIIRKGACYVRSLGKPETSEIPGQDEMRDLLDLAVQKGIRKFVERAVGAGLITFTRQSDAPDDAEKFSSQLGDLR